MSKAAGRRRRRAARFRPFWILFVVAAAALGAGGYYAATWPGFFPSAISVSGNRIVPAGEILARAAIARDVNIWLQNMSAASARIESIPYVDRAAIHRGLPARVRIVVTERTPYAVLAFGQARVLVDRDLRVLQIDDARRGLPVFVLAQRDTPAAGTFVTAPDVQRMRSDELLLAQAHVAVSQLSRDRFGDLVAVMPSGLRLLLGDDSDLARKAALVGPILSQAGANGRPIEALDLRAARTPVVVYAPLRR